MSVPAERLTSLLAPVVGAAGADLEALSVSAAGRRRVVRVVVDRDGGVSLDDVAELSRLLSEALDDIEAREPALLGGAYVLEVSSPGVDRPLTQERHWRRNVGRLVTVTLREGGTVSGRLLSADDASLVLDVQGRERTVALAAAVKGVVQVEFDRKGGAGPEEPHDTGGPEGEDPDADPDGADLDDDADLEDDDDDLDDGADLDDGDPDGPEAQPHPEPHETDEAQTR